MSTELAPALTTREARWVRFVVVDGMSESAAMVACGWKGYRDCPVRFPNIAAMRAQVERMKVDLTAHAAAETLIDAGEIHEYLTDALRARISDIRRDDGSFLPTSEWPDIWQRMYEAGDCEIEQLNARSADGEDKEKQGGWDSIGTVTKVKIKFASRVKLLELAMKHKGVNAMVQERQADQHLHLHGSIVEILQGALARKARIVEAPNVTP